MKKLPQKELASSLAGRERLIKRDLQHIWHPCSQMKDYETFPPLIINQAKGSYLHLDNGKKIIDAVSSWWCKSLGHNHPKLKAALLTQVDKFEHVILANTTNEVIVELSEKLCSLTRDLNKVFYASDGSCAIEIALKMSMQSRQLQGQSQKTKFLALQNSYHGETCLALAVSDVGIYKDPFAKILPPANFLQGIPYVNGPSDKLWQDCSSHWPNIEKQLEKLKDSLTAIILEPILQGAGGMRIYSADFLYRLGQWAKQHDIHIIADEIMTGFGRTGLEFAYQHANANLNTTNFEPDFLCIGKGLTSGWLPLSAVMTKDSIYELFYGDYSKSKAFLHSHTFSGNPLAASIAIACLDIFKQENTYQHAANLGKLMLQLMQGIAADTGKLTNVRSIGAMVAADLVGKTNQRLGYKVYQKAVELGALLRPLGNTIYWLPPLNTPAEVIYELADITKAAITASFNSAELTNF